MTPTFPRRRALGLALGAASGLACRTRHSPPGGTWPLGERLLALAGETGHPPDRTTGAELERLAGQVEAARSAGRSPVAALNHVVFEQRGFVREIEDQGGRFMLLPPVLASRRGSCLGLGTLYLALAERLGWQAHGVLVPGHFFVRVQDGPGAGSDLRNVELLRQGEAMPEAWYRQKYRVPSDGVAAYLRPLTVGEVVAVIHFNLGNERRQAGRLSEARGHYGQAVTGFPGFPEAQASLGLTHHLLGQLSAARQAYRKAAELHPGLPGLERNMALLEQEIAGARP